MTTKTLPADKHVFQNGKIFDQINGKLYDITIVMPSGGPASTPPLEEPVYDSGTSHDRFFFHTSNTKTEWGLDSRWSEWSGQSVAVDVWQSWGSSHNSMTVRLQESNWSGQSYFSADYQFDRGQSETKTYTTTVSTWYDEAGWSLFTSQETENDTFNWSNVKLWGEEEITSQTSTHTSHLESVLETSFLTQFVKEDSFEQTDFTSHTGDGWGVTESNTFMFVESHTQTAYNNWLLG